jgi:hypothetical protein
MAARKEAGRREMLEKLWERFGKEHELFTTYAHARMGEFKPKVLALNLQTLFKLYINWKPMVCISSYVGYVLMLPCHPEDRGSS